MHQQGTSSEGSFVAMVVFFCVFYKVISQERKIILKLHFISSIKIKEWGLLLAQRGR